MIWSIPSHAGTVADCLNTDLSPEYVKVLRSETLKCSPEQLWGLMRDHTQLDWRPTLPNIDVPCLNLYGGASKVRHWHMQTNALHFQRKPFCSCVCQRSSDGPVRVEIFSCESRRARCCTQDRRAVLAPVARDQQARYESMRRMMRCMSQKECAMLGPLKKFRGNSKIRRVSTRRLASSALPYLC